MAQLSIAQRTFIVKTFYETGSLQQTLNQFKERDFQKNQIWRLVYHLVQRSKVRAENLHYLLSVRLTSNSHQRKYFILSNHF